MYAIFEEMKKRLGMSLIEVLFSMFFISAAVLGVAGLFDSGLRMQTKIEKRLIATNIATSEMDKLRAWASRSDNFADWQVQEGVARPTSHSGFTYSIQSELMTLHSPCTLIGANRTMTSSARKVRLEVAWGQGASDRVRLVSIISAPAVAIAGVQVTGGTFAPVDPNATVDFQARAVDRYGQVIPDVFFNWWVQIGTANGTVTEAPDGRVATFQHGYIIPGSPPIHYPAGSTCAVGARAHFLGQEVNGLSSAIIMGGP